MSPHDPVLVNSSGGFPIELIILLFVLLGLVILSFWLASVFAKKNRGGSSVAEPVTQSGDSPFLSLQRGPEGGWVIHVAGHLYPALDAVPDEATRQEVLAGLKALAAFSRAYLKKPAKPAPETKPPVQQPTAKPAAEAPEPPEFSVTQAASVTPLEAMEALRALKERTRRKAQEMPSAPTVMPPPQIMPTIDLAREIGKIVADLQTRSPELRGRMIKLRNASGGGVIFVVEGKVYHRVEEIPDAAVRSLIREATREWERRR